MRQIDMCEGHPDDSGFLTSDAGQFRGDAHSYNEEPSDGQKLVSLLIGSQSWVHRRVDALRLSGDGTTRLHVSLDVTVPADLRLARPGGQMAVPLALMEKVPLRHLDTEDWTGKSMAVLDTPLNSRYAFEFLSALTPRWVREDRVWGAIQTVLGELVESDGGPDALSISKRLEALLERGEHRRSPLSEDESLELSAFTSIAKQLGQQFLFMVEIDAERVETRTILKYSVDQDAPRHSRGQSKRVVFRLQVPDMGFAASQHIEVELPDGVVLERLTLEGTIFEGDLQEGLATDEPEGWLQRTSGHVTVRPNARFLKGELWVWVVPAKQGLYRFAKVSIVMVTLVVCATWLIRANSEVLLREVVIPSPSASILLIGPALLLSWFSRTTEHTLVAKVQGPLRLALLGTALVLLIMAALAAVPVTAEVWAIAWVVATCIQSAAFLLLLYFASDLRRKMGRRDF
ncbi:hypothetical protein QF031_000934 [Pseudarthrobacter defluvii]|uniref:hypothetical protein n=1 Tax=Pseudarthrobacter defluvii TaxID=410837 RepID=UPI0027868C9B|nr:hypothetical protein [Pseudarthrobacter defluvii]MDQ0768185.1 hypothetical protein [Pseudarthrobacter defluvii]